MWDGAAVITIEFRMGGPVVEGQEREWNGRVVSKDLLKRRFEGAVDLNSNYWIQRKDLLVENLYSSRK